MTVPELTETEAATVKRFGLDFGTHDLAEHFEDEIAWLESENYTGLSNGERVSLFAQHLVRTVEDHKTVCWQEGCARDAI